MPAPVASGWSGRRVGLAPTGKAPPCHGARGLRTFARPRSRDKVAADSGRTPDRNGNTRSDPKKKILAEYRIVAGMDIEIPRGPVSFG